MESPIQAYGEVKLAGASIGGQLIFRGAHLDGKGEAALTADGLKGVFEVSRDAVTIL
jgi:hypothetical protein